MSNNPSDPKMIRLIPTSLNLWTVIPDELMRFQMKFEVNGSVIKVHPGPMSLPRALKLTQTINSDYILDIKYKGLRSEPMKEIVTGSGNLTYGVNSNLIYQVFFPNLQFLKAWLLSHNSGNEYASLIKRATKNMFFSERTSTP